MAWILFTFLAAFSQAWRNAFQSRLSAHVGVAGVTLSRFLFGGPIALVYLSTLYYIQPAPMPDFGGDSVFYICAAASMQIIATGLMVVLFKQKNFAIGAGLAKSEAIVAAILGMLFFGTTLTALGWIGVFIGTIAVFLLSCPHGFRSLSPKTALLGIACGTSFALCSLQTVPYVKTLGQVEIFFTMLVSFLWLKEPVKRKDMLALIMVAIAAILVMWQ